MASIIYNRNTEVVLQHTRNEVAQLDRRLGFFATQNEVLHAPEAIFTCGYQIQLLILVN